MCAVLVSPIQNQLCYSCFIHNMQWKGSTIVRLKGILGHAVINRDFASAL